MGFNSVFKGLTVLETLEIIRKPELLQARVSLWQHKVWIVAHLWYKYTKKIPVRTWVSRGTA